MREAEVKEAAGAPELSIAPAPCVCAPQPQSLRRRVSASTHLISKYTAHDGDILRLRHIIIIVIIFGTKLF